MKNTQIIVRHSLLPYHDFIAKTAPECEVIMEIMIQLVLLVIGFVLLIKGADWFVDGTAGIAEKMGIPQLVIGLTIVAMGTSAPEAAVSISSALKGNAGITIGNIVGSNILNVLLILGLTAVIVSIKVAKSTVLYEIPFMILITVILLLLGITGGTVSLTDGIILWVFFILYLAYLFVMTKKQETNTDETQKENEPVWKLIVLTVIGILMIIAGSRFSVDGATAIAQIIGISDRVIGLTVVALGTSLPELVTSVAAAKKGNADIAIGNIVGSNIFNILFVVGTASFIIPVSFSNEFILDTIIAAGAGILLLIGVVKTQKLNRPIGVVMLLCYMVYVTSNFL